jgi:hypothetical protein
MLFDAVANAVATVKATKASHCERAFTVAYHKSVSSIPEAYAYLIVADESMTIIKLEMRTSATRTMPTICRGRCFL